MDAEIAERVIWEPNRAEGLKAARCYDTAKSMCARYTTSLDAALTLVPETACNHQLFSFGGHGVEIDGFPKMAWGFGFADTAQLMGERAAKEEIERMICAVGWGDFAGPPRVKMEKAIAEHFIEFNCRCAATPALALCIAALKARQAMEAAA